MAPKLKQKELNKQQIERLFYWIKERYSIYLKKEERLPKPWTDDSILQNFRFCNPYRELDKVTIWIRKNWREPHKVDPDLWFAMAVARLVNWPDSLEVIGYPVPWNPGKFVEALDRRKRNGKKVFTGAYMIHAGRDHIGKAEYLAEEVLTPMWEDRKKIRPTDHDSLADFYERLHNCKDMGSFMTGQVVADVKYTIALQRAKDWWTWATPGPGSQRGLNRVMKRDVKTPWKPKDWLKCLNKLQDKINVKVLDEGLPRLHAQDLQNCLCEFDKWCRVKYGEGRPRSRYDGVGPQQEVLRFPRYEG